MGLLAGSITYRRFRVEGALPDGFREVFIDGIGDHHFKENDGARTKEDNVGWVNILDPADVDLHLNKFLYTNFLVVSMRVDKKRVPGKYLTIKVNREVRKTLEERGIPRISASHKRDIKEAVEEDLLGRALPVVGVYDMAWDLDAREVWLFNATEAMMDAFRMLFVETFRLELTPISLADWAIGELDLDAIGEQGQALEPVQWHE